METPLSSKQVVSSSSMLRWFDKTFLVQPHESGIAWFIKLCFCQSTQPHWISAGFLRCRYNHNKKHFDKILICRCMSIVLPVNVNAEMWGFSLEIIEILWHDIQQTLWLTQEISWEERKQFCLLSCYFWKISHSARLTPLWWEALRKKKEKKRFCIKFVYEEFKGFTTVFLV